MKTLITRVRNLLVLLLCAAPLLIWAISPSIQGLSVTSVPQLSFAQAQIQRLATNLTPFTQTATSPYSKGAISYSSTQPGVASVNASTGEVTPRSVGETSIVATQAAAAPFPAATAKYTVQLTGAAPVFQNWTLPTKTYAGPTSYNIGTGPSDLPPPQSTSNGAISYRLKDPATMASIATVATNNNVTTVNVLKTGTIILVAEQAATTQYAAGSIEAPLVISALPTAPPVNLAYGATQTLGSTVSGVTGAVTYRVANAAVATISGLTIKATGVGTTTLFAVQGTQDVASGTVTVTMGKPTLSFPSPTINKTVNDKPFELQAGSVDLVTGIPRIASVTYAVTSTTNTNAVKILGDGKTVWIAQGGTVEITATQIADANHEEATAKMSLNISGQALPWVEIKQALPGTVLRNQEYTIRVLTNSPTRLPLAMFNQVSQQFLDGTYWNEVSPSTPSSRGPNIEDVYVVKFDNPDTADISVRSLLGTPDAWNFPGFIPAPFYQWPLGNTTLSRVISGPDVAFPRATPYEFTLGTTPSDADAAIPSNVIVTYTDDAIARPELVSSTPSGDTYKLVPVGVGTYTLRGLIKGGINDNRTTSITVTVKPQPTVLSSLTPITLTMDSNRVEVRPPVSSRPGTPSFTYKIPDADSNIAALVFEGGKYYVKPVSVAGSTTLTITQAAAGNYAEGTTSTTITVNAGAAPISVFLPDIMRTYGDVDVLMPLPTTGFNPDQVVGGNITFNFNDTTSNLRGPVASAMLDSSGKIVIGILHAGVTTLTVTQGSNTAITTITVKKGTPYLQYNGAMMTLQQGMCYLNPDVVRMPLLNAGSTGTNELYSTSDGVITYSITATNLMTFGTRLGSTTPYNEGYLYGVQPNNYASVAGDLYPLRVDQAETADYLGTTLAVPSAFLIKGRSDGPFNCAG